VIGIYLFFEGLGFKVFHGFSPRIAVLNYELKQIEITNVPLNALLIGLERGLFSISSQIKWHTIFRIPHSLIGYRNLFLTFSQTVTFLSFKFRGFGSSPSQSEIGITVSSYRSSSRIQSFTLIFLVTHVLGNRPLALWQGFLINIDIFLRFGRKPKMNVLILLLLDYQQFCR